MSERSQETLVKKLEQSRDELVGVVADVSDEDAARSPEAGRWSVLQVLEHLVVVEGRIHDRIQTAQPLSGVDRGRDEYILAFTQDRSNRVNAPDPIQPRGLFTSVKGAAEEFRQRREKTIVLCRSKTLDELSGVAVQHPVFGTIDLYQTLLASAAHVSRHCMQIAEVKRAVIERVKS